MTVLPPQSLNLQGVPLLNSKSATQSTVNSSSSYETNCSYETRSVITASQKAASIPHKRSGTKLISSENTRLVSCRYSPCCELAELAVKQMVILQLSPMDITKAMGYPRQHTVAAKERLRMVLNSPYLGLDGCFMDPYFDAENFLYKLCQLLGIDETYYQSEVAKI